MHRCLSFQAILLFWAVLKVYILEAAKPCHTGLPQGQLLSKFCHCFFSLSFGLKDVYNWVFIKPKSLDLSTHPRECCVVGNCLRCCMLLNSIPSLIDPCWRWMAFPTFNYSNRKCPQIVPFWGGGKQRQNCPDWESLFLGCKENSPSCKVCCL